jgi:hypothetical protein
MSLYEMIGDLLAGAGEVLGEGHIAGRDDRSQRDLRQIALLNKRLAAMWPDLFASLWRENVALQATLDDVRARIEAHGLAPDPIPPGSDDPVALNARLIRALNEAQAILHAHAEEAWAVDARRVLRHGVTEAIGAAEGIVEAAWHA